MRKIAEIRVFEDEALLRWMVRASLAVLSAGVAAGVAWWFAVDAFNAAASSHVPAFELDRAFGAWGARLLGAEGAASVDVLWWVMLAVGVAASFAGHELVHAWLFRRFAPLGARVRLGANLKMGMLYASAEGVVFPRSRYLLAVLAPSVVVSLVALAIGVGLGWPLWTLVVATIHLSGCTGDWTYARIIHSDPAIRYCKDTAWGAELYGDDETPARTVGAQRVDRAGFTVVEGGRVGSCVDDRSEGAGDQ